MCTTGDYLPFTYLDPASGEYEGIDIGVGGMAASLERAERAFNTEATLDEGKAPITLCENVEKHDTIEEIIAGRADVLTMDASETTWVANDGTVDAAKEPRFG